MSRYHSLTLQWGFGVLRPVNVSYWHSARNFMTVAIIKDGHVRIIIMRPETILH
jgi:hypothetical protein